MTIEVPCLLAASRSWNEPRFIFIKGIAGLLINDLPVYHKYT